MTIIQQNSGTIQPAVSGFTVTLPGATAATSRIVVCIAGNTVVNTPSGWTSRSPQVNTMGHYIFDRVGDTASSWAFTNGAGHLSWHVFEVANGAFDSSAGANAGSSAQAAYAGAALTPTAGDREIIASFGFASSGAPAAVLSGYTNGFTEAFSTATSSGEFIRAGTARLAVTANGSTAYSTSVDHNRDVFARSSIIAAYSTLSSGAPATVTGALAAATASALAPTITAGTTLASNGPAIATAQALAPTVTGGVGAVVSGGWLLGSIGMGT